TIALQGFERIDLTSGAVSGATTNPRFYQTTIYVTDIPGGTNKLLSSLTFSKPAANSTGIYAVSGATNGFQTNVVFSLAAVTNLPATSITTTGAVVNGQVLSTGNDAPQLTLFYGPSNGGNPPAAWSNSLSLGWQTGSLSQTISGLAYSSTYFFTFRAINAAGTSWATPSRSFVTQTPTLAVVTNLPATAISANSAALNGQVLATGGDPPSITIYYGPVNGGTTPSASSNSIPFGIKSGFL